MLASGVAGSPVVPITTIGPAPAPVIEIWPKRATLCYGQGDHNAYIDDSNKMQLFEARLSHTTGSAVEWLVDGVLQAGTAPTFLYMMPNLGGTHLATVRARVQAQPGVFDDAVESSEFDADICFGGVAPGLFCASADGAYGEVVFVGVAEDL